MNIHRFVEVTSTNDEARKLISQGAPSGTVVVAQTQSAGRGRSGRSWFSPPDDNLYMSYVHRTHLAPSECAGLTIDAGVALAELLTRRGLDIELKWPNDVLLNGLKIAGILCELVTDKERPVVIVGIGLNVNGSDFPVELSSIATSLFAATHEPQDLERIEQELIREFERAFSMYEARRAPNVEGYRRHFRMQGRQVTLGGGEVGLIEGVGDDGGLVVNVGGESRSIRSGEVKFAGVTR